MPAAEVLPASTASAGTRLFAAAAAKEGVEAVEAAKAVSRLAVHPILGLAVIAIILQVYVNNKAMIV
jgi:hypothetical protein